MLHSPVATGTFALFLPIPLTSSILHLPWLVSLLLSQLFVKLMASSVLFHSVSTLHKYVLLLQITSILPSTSSSVKSQPTHNLAAALTSPSPLMPKPNFTTQ